MYVCVKLKNGSLIQLCSLCNPLHKWGGVVQHTGGFFFFLDLYLPESLSLPFLHFPLPSKVSTRLFSMRFITLGFLIPFLTPSKPGLFILILFCIQLLYCFYNLIFTSLLSFHSQGRSSDYHLWVISGRDNPAYPLIGKNSSFLEWRWECGEYLQLQLVLVVHLSWAGVVLPKSTMLSKDLICILLAKKTSC